MSLNDGVQGLSASTQPLLSLGLQAGRPAAVAGRCHGSVLLLPPPPLPPRSL
jgi:hypothetical protein